MINLDFKREKAMCTKGSKGFGSEGRDLSSSSQLRKLMRLGLACMSFAEVLDNVLSKKSYSVIPRVILTWALNARH